MPATGPNAWNTPDYFVGKTIVSAYEPYAQITGSNYSSINAGSLGVVHWVQPSPVNFKNLVMAKSLNAGLPAATSQNSSGSEAWTYALSAFLYNRQDYATNSTNLSFVASGSYGLTGTMSYSSSSQSYGMSWVTDTAGGTSSFSTSSSDSAWSNYATGPKLFSLPFSTTIPAGEYWIMFQHSSTSATSGSNATLLSVSLLQQSGQMGAATWMLLGNSASSASLGGPNINVGVMAAPVTTSTTMAQSVISVNLRAPVWFAMSNA